MDSASIIQRPSLFHGGDGSSFCFSDRLISAKLCPKGISNRFQFGNRLRTPSAGRFYLHSTKSMLGYGRQAKHIPFGFRISCQGSDSLGNAESNDRNVEFSETNDQSETKDVRAENQTDSLEELRDLLHNANKELEVARLNSTMLEEKAQRISETAISLKDEAASAWLEVNKSLDVMRDMVDEESVAKDAVQNATTALSLAEARLRVVLEEAGGSNGIPEASQETDLKVKEEALSAAKDDIKECQVNLENCEAQLSCLQSKKEELQKQVDKLNEFAETIQINALKAE